MEKFWGPRPQVLSYAESLIGPGASVLEIGPGHLPFAKATCFVDCFDRAGLPGPLHCVDVIRQPLPFPDKSIDFVYCRHVIEDLVYPDLLLSEMQRVGRAGYIETPSPAAELTREVDGGNPPYRGYVHHRWVVWLSEGKVHLVEKGNAIEHLDFAGMESDRVLDDPFLWNTYLFWEGSFEYKRLVHWVDYDLHSTYRDLLMTAYAAGRLNGVETALRVRHS